MVFSSYEFILLFLPVVAIVFHVVMRKLPPIFSILWLIAASMVFYGWWSKYYLLLLLISCVINAAIGSAIIYSSQSRFRLALLVTGISFNLGVLGYFKYAGFAVANFAEMTGFKMETVSVLLPLGISFFVFQKIAFLVDAYRREITEFNFLKFILFVFFFPQLIAGPIVHHRELVPQFSSKLTDKADWNSVALGLTIFILGLGKKVIFADGFALYATPVFDAAASNVVIPFLEAWCGTIAYGLQIYFDFSGYSDMAVGLGLLFGIQLPINFNSPYKATSLIDFWRRWHITLSRFLRDYLYIPLGGNHVSMSRHFTNLFIVMFLGGLWHGAGWTFIFWGVLHGTGLIVNHLLRLLPPDFLRWRMSPWAGGAATFLFVMLAWIPFRAADMHATGNMYRGVIGLNGLVLPDAYEKYSQALSAWLLSAGVKFEVGYMFLGVKEILLLSFGMAVVWTLPNTWQWTGYAPFGGKNNSPLRWRWNPNFVTALCLSTYAMLCLFYTARGGEFLYFQF